MGTTKKKRKHQKVPPSQVTEDLKIKNKQTN